MHEIPFLKQFLINYQYLQEGFIGISLGTIGIVRVFYYCLLATILMLIVFLTGNMVRKVVVGHTSRHAFFANFALGYIIIGTVIGLLGVLSLLTVQILFSCLPLITILSVYMNRDTVTDFAYLDVDFIFSQDKRLFKLLKERGATKLLIKGGDLAWFCKRLSLTDCPQNSQKPLVTYPSGVRKYNFYTPYAL